MLIFRYSNPADMADRVTLEHFRNLVSLCAADGRIEAREKDSLIAIADALDIPRERLQVMLAHAHEYVHMVPQNSQDREKQLEDMIAIAFADGHFAPSERTLIKDVARKLGFSDEETEEFIEMYVRQSGV